MAARRPRNPRLSTSPYRFTSPHRPTTPGGAPAVASAHTDDVAPGTTFASLGVPAALAAALLRPHQKSPRPRADLECDHVQWTLERVRSSRGELQLRNSKCSANMEKICRIAPQPCSLELKYLTGMIALLRAGQADTPISLFYHLPPTT